MTATTHALLQIRWNYRYLYWHQNLCSAEAQQVLFAMDLTSRYIR